MLAVAGHLAKLSNGILSGLSHQLDRRGEIDSAPSFRRVDGAECAFRHR